MQLPSTVFFFALILGLCGPSLGFIDLLMGLLGGGRGRVFRIGGGSGGFDRFDRGGFGPVSGWRRGRRGWDRDRGFFRPDVVRDRRLHSDCQEPGAPKCPVGFECVTLSSIKSGEEHLCTKDISGHCECAEGCLYKGRFIPIDTRERPRSPVEIAKCEWCRCTAHGDHGHTDCFKDCFYRPPSTFHHT